jgi:hypothetical protein
MDILCLLPMLFLMCLAVGATTELAKATLNKAQERELVKALGLGLATIAALVTFWWAFSSTAILLNDDPSDFWKKVVEPALFVIPIVLIVLIYVGTAIVFVGALLMGLINWVKRAVTKK